MKNMIAWYVFLNFAGNVDGGFSFFLMNVGVSTGKNTLPVPLG